MAKFQIATVQYEDETTEKFVNEISSQEDMSTGILQAPANRCKFEGHFILTPSVQKAYMITYNSEIQKGHIMTIYLGGDTESKEWNVHKHKNSLWTKTEEGEWDIDVLEEIPEWVNWDWTV